MLGVRMRLMHKPLKLVSVNENLHIRSQRLIVLLENKAIRHFRAYMDMEKEGRLEVGAGSEGRLTGEGKWKHRTVLATLCLVDTRKSHLRGGSLSCKMTVDKTCGTFS